MTMTESNICFEYAKLLPYALGRAFCIVWHAWDEVDQTVGELELAIEYVQRGGYASTCPLSTYGRASVDLLNNILKKGSDAPDEAKELLGLILEAAFTGTLTSHSTLLLELKRVRQLSERLK